MKTAAQKMLTPPLVLPVKESREEIVRLKDSYDLPGHKNTGCKRTDTECIQVHTPKRRRCLMKALMKSPRYNLPSIHWVGETVEWHRTT